MRKFMALLAVWAMLGVGTVHLTKDVAAYNDYGSYACGFYYSGSGTLWVPYASHPTYPPTGVYYNAYVYAQSSWNVGPHPAIFSGTGGSNHTRAVRAVGSSGPRGHIDRYCIGLPSTRSSTEWYVNSDHPQLASSDFWKQSAAAHESGHHIWTSHSVIANAIMDPYRSGPNNGPIQDDWCAVQYRYPSSAYPLQCGYVGGP